MSRIDTLWGRRNDYSIQHVNRAQNSQADVLSKRGLLSQMGKWKMDIKIEDETYSIQDFSLPGT